VTIANIAVPGRRLALVIGNGAYNVMPDFLQKLKNPVNDAVDITKALQGIGFTVTLLTDATLQQMTDAIYNFGTKLHRDDLVIFYYAGHGMQIKGVNYLFPVDSNFQREDQIKYQAVQASEILDKIQVAKTKLVFLDACRNNPYLKRGRGTGVRGGLAKMDTPAGTLLVYATDPNNFAADGKGRNGTFTKHLLRHIRQPGDIQLTLRTVRADVRAETKNLQTPWDTSSLEGPVYLVSAAPEDPEKAKLRAQLAAAKRAKAEAEQAKAEAEQARVAAEAEAQAKADEAARLAQEKAATQARLQEAQAAAQSPQQVQGYSPQHQSSMMYTEQRKSYEPEMVSIPAGSFMMGSPDNEEGRDSDEGPVHKVYIKAFKMGKYEVTRGQFRAFVNATNYKTEAERGNGCYGLVGTSWEQKKEFNWRNVGFSQTDQHPVVCVIGKDAYAYTEWLSRKTGKKYRLPTEAEWEYAARAGTTTSRYWGDDPDRACRYANVADQAAKRKFSDWWTIHNCDDGYVFTAPVGRFQANRWGLEDMLGNVWEWTCSEYVSPYNGSEKRCLSKNRAKGLALRGGSWNHVPRNVRAAYRNDNDDPSNYKGFRVAGEGP